jgi:diguanylate cyclase (GGDEF)-like protein
MSRVSFNRKRAKLKQLLGIRAARLAGSRPSNTAASCRWMIDVDHFKLFNDTYGHPEGDACLARLGETLAGIAAKTMGFAARYGGEEFCLLLPTTDSKRALEIGEIVRAAVLNLAMPHCTSHHQTVTVSVGVACAKPNDGQRPGDLIEAADAALYAAKHRGRNAVVAHGFVRRMTDGAVAVAS